MCLGLTVSFVKYKLAKACIPFLPNFDYQIGQAWDPATACKVQFTLPSKPRVRFGRQQY